LEEKMSDEETYERFVEWLGKTWWELPKSEHLMPTIKVFYTPEEATLLTGIPFSGRSLEELAEEILKQAAESGLVHAISNWKQRADTICNYCCLFMEAYHVLKHSKERGCVQLQGAHQSRDLQGMWPVC